VKKTWVSILIATVVICGIAAVMLVGGAALFVYRHTNAAFVATTGAEEEFAQARARFAGQTPLVEFAGKAVAPVRDDRAVGGDDADHDLDKPHFIVHRGGSSERRPIGALHILTYQGRTHKLVRVDLPGWLLNLSSLGGHLRIASLEGFQSDGDRLTLEDIERHGPGLILDLSRSRRNQVLIWTD
jgi:hypothetical protein